MAYHHACHPVFLLLLLQGSGEDNIKFTFPGGILSIPSFRVGEDVESSSGSINGITEAPFHADEPAGRAPREI